MKKVVLIKWLDAESSADERWMPLDEAYEYATEKLKPCYSVGFLMAERNDHVTIATSNGADVIGTIWKIPRGMIEEIIVIHELKDES